MTAPRILPRDIDPTGFTPTLEALVQGIPEALCAAFIDTEGETIDLTTRIDPFEARIAGAEMAIALARVLEFSRELGHGQVTELRVTGERRTLLARHVGEGCELVLVVLGSSVSARAAELCAATAIALRAEARLKSPPALAVLRSVEQRTSLSGLRLPRAFDDSGQRRRVTALLGVLEEPANTSFLVRTDQGEELVVVHDHATGHWRRQL